MDLNEQSGNRVLPKWLVQGLGGLLIALVALAVIQKVQDLKNTFTNTKPANTISVMGQGKVTATPDLAMVTLGVLSQGKTAVDVKNENNDKVNKVIAYIKAQGVDAADISTSQFSFYPQQDYNNGNPRITGYQGNQTVTVKIRGVDKSQDQLNKILDGSVNNGANEINAVNLTIDKPADLQNQAKKMAIEDAKKKAQELASAAGLNLGKVVSLSENSGGYPGPIPYAMGIGGGGDMMAKTIAPNVQPGSQEISETMTVVFEVK